MGPPHLGGVPLTAMPEPGSAASSIRSFQRSSRADAGAGAGRQPNARAIQFSSRWDGGVSAQWRASALKRRTVSRSSTSSQLHPVA
jgi:hypothetical protein